MEEIGEKTVLTETRYPQEILVRAGETDTLASNVALLPRLGGRPLLIRQEQCSDQNRDTDPGRS